MNYLLYYFTGTGNSWRAVKLIGKSVEEAGHSCQIRKIEPGTAPPGVSDSFDRLVLVFPVYSFAPPNIVKQFIRRIGSTPEELRNRFGSAQIPTAVLTIDGGDGIRACSRSRRMLSRRGCSVFLTSRAGYGNNWRQMMNPPGPEKLPGMTAEGDQAVLSFSGKLIGNETGHYQVSRFSTLWSGLTAALFTLIGRRMLALYFTADEDCTSCGLCARSCPVQAIRMVPAASSFPAHQNLHEPGEEYFVPEWKQKCESCNRCINICPVGAINTSIGRMFLSILMILLISVLLLRFFQSSVLTVMSGRIFEFPLLLILIRMGLILAAHFITLFLMNPLCRLLCRIPGMRSLMTKSFNKRFRQYHAEGFKVQ